MTQVNVRRLLRAFVPFSIMALMQRGLLLLFGIFSFSSKFASLLAFLPAVLCCALVFSLIKNRSTEEEYEEFPPLSKKSIACSFMQTAVAVAIMVAMMYAVSLILDEALTDEVEMSVFTVISLVFIHPITEEYVFRGLIYGEMRKMNPVFATLAQAVMFAIVHDTVNGMLYALVAGVALAALVEVSGRLSTSIAAHMIINARSLLYMTVFADKKGLTGTIDIMIFVLGAICLVGLGVIRGLYGDVESGEDILSGGEILEAEDDEE